MVWRAFCFAAIGQLAAQHAVAESPGRAAPRDLATALASKAAYAHPVFGEVMHFGTHSADVFLAGPYAYKVKKPVNFGFLDFSTVEKRKASCTREVELNRRLCPGVYLGVVPVTQQGEQIRVGGPGEVIDWAVQMRKLPPERLMSTVLDQHRVSRNQIRDLAKIVAEFHGSERPVLDRRYGSPTLVAEQVADLGSVREVFEQALGKGAVVDTLLGRADAFVTQQRGRFVERQDGGFVRRLHGDLHTGNAFLTQPLVVFDAIDFNKDFSQTDTAAEVAFMAMDLDAHGRDDLSRLFVNEYLRRSGDLKLLGLLPFYKCYRANVRAKVAALSYRQNPTDKAKDEMAKYLSLAERYAREFAP